MRATEVGALDYDFGFIYMPRVLLVSYKQMKMSQLISIPEICGGANYQIFRICAFLAS